ncbi:MAG: thioredoxin [Patescibacteria group bacterium]|nr:thioredoxin [Patescibacteria group bacterium]
MTKVFTDENFETEVLKSAKVVLVDFWAPWCGPCQIMGPIIEELAAEMEEKAIIGKMNVDENPKKAEEYQIMSIPAILVFKKGSLIDQTLGVQSKDSLKTILLKHMEEEDKTTQPEKQSSDQKPDA